MATYDPNKTYSWGPETKFVLSGQNFSLLLHTLRGFLSTKEATNTILAYELNKQLENIMAEAVAEGKIVETPSPEDPQASQALENVEDTNKKSSKKLTKA